MTRTVAFFIVLTLPIFYHKHLYLPQIVDLDDQVTAALLDEKDGVVAAIEWETEIAQYGEPGIASFDPYDAINMFAAGGIGTLPIMACGLLVRRYCLARATAGALKG